MTARANPFQRVVVATDFSPGSAAATERAAWLPLSGGAVLSLVHVMPGTLPRAQRTGALDRANQRLRGVAAHLRRAVKKRGVDAHVESTVLVGTPYVEIVRYARTNVADLVVVGRHGRRPIRDAFIGSTAERVVRKGEVPILLVHGRAGGPYRRVLAAIEVTDAARPIVDLARALQPEDAGPLTMVHAFHVGFEAWLEGDAREGYRRECRSKATLRVETIAAASAARGIDCRVVVREGDPRIVILREALRRRSDLIVAGTHARSGIAHAFLGSIAEWLIRAARCDVAVTRPARFTFELP